MNWAIIQLWRATFAGRLSYRRLMLAVTFAVLGLKWKDAIRRSWQDPNGPSIRHDTNEAFRIVAEMRRDADLINEYENAQRMSLTPERAYETLEVPFNVDEDMLITVYNMRVWFILNIYLRFIF